MFFTFFNTYIYILTLFTDEEPFGHDDNDNFPFLTSFFEDEPAAEGNDYEFPSVFSSIFDSNEEDQDEPVCGFLCTFLNDFDKRLKVLTDEVKTIHQVSNTKEDEYDVNNSTYTEKVLFLFKGQIIEGIGIVIEGIVFSY